MTTREQSGEGQVSPEAWTSREALLTGLRSRDGSVRQAARKALTSMGGQAVPGLVPLLDDSHDDVRWEAAKTLADIGDPGAAPALVTTLEDEDTGVRWLAAVGLIAMGREALAPVLEALLERPHSVWLRDGAHHVLHDLMKADLEDLLAPILRALESIEPGIGLRGPTSRALRLIRR